MLAENVQASQVLTLDIKPATPIEINPDRLAQCLTAALRILRNDKSIIVRRVITEPKNGEVSA